MSQALAVQPIYTRCFTVMKLTEVGSFSGVSLLLIVGEASVMFHSAQREGLPSRIKEIDRI